MKTTKGPFKLTSQTGPAEHYIQMTFRASCGHVMVWRGPCVRVMDALSSSIPDTKMYELLSGMAYHKPAGAYDSGYCPRVAYEQFAGSVVRLLRDGVIPKFSFMHETIDKPKLIQL